jgi:hypothetical protein
VNELLQLLLPTRLLQPLLKPIVRLFLGFIAIPIFRMFVRRVVRVNDLDEELEKDLEQWFRGALLLLIATQNMESTIFGWVRPETRESVFFMGGRLLLAIGVIEGMPDQSLFALIYPGPQPPKIERGRVVWSLIRYLPSLGKGLICQHLNRSSPVLAILAVIWPDETAGWVCYGMAIGQYLLIGLVASKDKALGVLQKFDEAVARQRQEIENEIHMLAEARQQAAVRFRGHDHQSEM